VKQLINKACQLKLQSGVFDVTSLFISLSKQYLCVCVTAGEEIDRPINIFTTHLLTPGV